MNDMYVAVLEPVFQLRTSEKTQRWMTDLTTSSIGQHEHDSIVAVPQSNVLLK